jgi:CheY-like chemotaxis protein
MGNETILVIEDNALNMKLVKSLLDMGMYRVLAAENAESGMQVARENHPDLILMDIQLPGMDGLTATKILKANQNLQAIPIVALTSHAMEGDDKKALDAGCDGYIAKPIDTKSFLTTIGQFLKG